MRIKVRPEDFRVEELLQLRLARHGHYSIYRLEKRGWTTLALLDHIRRKHRLGRLSRAGLKDRQSVSVQYVSVEGRGPGHIAEESFTLKHIGYATRPITRDLLLGNRFGIMIRDMTREETALAQQNLSILQSDGFANYFDEQRFGSSRPGEGFVGGRLIRGDLNGALRLYMATPSGSDDPEVGRGRKLMDECWGDWARCLKHAKREFLPVLSHLKRRPDDFEGAVRRIKRELIELFITSYQSFLWNETLVELIKSLELPAAAVRYSQGELLFFTSLSSAARKFFERHEIPMASPLSRVRSAECGVRSYRTDNAESGERNAERGMSGRIVKAVRSVLTREGLEPNDLKLPFRIEGLYFRPYTRPGIVFPRELALSSPEPDELYRGRQRMELTFELPPGSYATILVRRLMLEEPLPADFQPPAAGE
jgi:tRNA pseudouridine13 synthase